MRGGLHDSAGSRLPGESADDAEGEDIGSHAAEMFDDCCSVSEE